MNPHKSFLDKAVQTDLSEVALNTSPSRDSYTFSPPDPLGYLPALDISQSSDTSSAYHSLSRFGAYTYSDISFLGDSRYLSDRPATNSSRSGKYGQLAYNKPIGSPNVNNRTVSLPETSPHRIAQENTVRVVSMPESLEKSRHSTALSEDYLDHSECLSPPSLLDAESNLRESFANCTLFPSSPETSFPPSSPESVVIIGNDTQVHPTFLRPKFNIEDEERNGGWIPARGSPPKPIPALHGPLSLPYARCPSGAEGTVVEGEDLTHMIWGLDSNGLQAVPTKPAHVFVHKAFHPFTASSHKPILYQEDIAYSLRDQDVIDLSRPDFHTSLPKGSDSMSQQKQASRTYRDAFEDSLKNVSDRNVGIYEFVRRDSPIQLYPGTVGLSQSDARAWTAGLGIDLWQYAHENDSAALSETIFSHADKGESQSLLGSNRHFELTDGTRRIYSTPLGFSVHDALTSGGQGQRSGILTPPDTGSPRWSPRFHQTSHFFVSPDVHHDNRHDYVGVSDSRTPEELLALYKERETAYFAGDNGRRGETRRRSVSSETADFSSTTSPEAARRASTIQPILKARASQNRTDPAHGATPPSPVSPDLRRNLSQQQTRSIPLTRLIQRRLSSVAEEEYETENVKISRDDKFAVTPSLTSIVTSKRQIPKEIESVRSQRTQRSSGDNRKQTTKPLTRVSQYTPGNAPNTSTETHNETNANTEKPNTKPKKSYRKKKYAKKQTTSEN